MRYALCLNPARAERERQTRLEIIEKTKGRLEEIAVPKRKTDDGKLGVRVDKITEEEQFDGHYVIFTDVPSGQMNIQEVVNSYKSLVKVEQAFRNLKSPILEIRPVFHRTDDRIRCHVSLCMLSYYLLWHMKQRLQPLFDNDINGRRKEYTIEHIVNILKTNHPPPLQVVV